jgi:monofunctional glycosyltransferase
MPVKRLAGIALGVARGYAKGMNSGTSGLAEPTADPEPEGLEMPAKGKGSSRWSVERAHLRLWARRALLFLVALALAPAVLTFLYLPSFVHPVSTLMLADLATFRGYDRQWVAIDEIAPVLVHSVIMSEDGQFCAHNGIDWGELNLVIDDAMAGEPTRGASTIPMQTVKNLYLWHGRSFVRKVLEAPLALYFDAITPKKRIMEIYLNIVEWGPGIYGVEAAAQHHFGRSSKELSRRQAALLAVTLPNPRERNPAKPGSGLRRLASVIERRAQRSGDYVRCAD